MLIIISLTNINRSRYNIGSIHVGLYRACLRPLWLACIELAWSNCWRVCNKHATTRACKHSNKQPKQTSDQPRRNTKRSNPIRKRGGVRCCCLSGNIACCAYDTFVSLAIHIDMCKLGLPSTEIWRAVNLCFRSARSCSLLRCCQVVRVLALVS